MTTFYFTENVSVTPNNSLRKVSKSSGFNNLTWSAIGIFHWRKWEKPNARISLHWQQKNSKNTLHEHAQNLLERSVGSHVGLLRDHAGILPRATSEFCRDLAHLDPTRNPLHYCLGITSGSNSNRTTRKSFTLRVEVSINNPTLQ